METIELRPSMLPSYYDCPRRAAAKQFRKQIEAAGYSLRETQQSAGAAIGTALHAAAAEVLRQKQVDPYFGYSGDTVKTAVAYAMDSVDKAFERGVEPDATTKNLTHAYAQIEKMTRALIEPCFSMQPEQIEHALEAELTAVIPILTEHGAELVEIPVRLKGTLDLREATRALRDFKTGAREPSPQAQLGGYDLLCSAHGLENDQVGIVFVPRVGVTKDQPPAVTRTYDRGTCQVMAWNTIHDIARHVYAFGQTGDCNEFPISPQSQMCSPKYCPAHSTPFCTEGKRVKTEDNE